MTKAMYNPNVRSAATCMRQAEAIYKRLFEISSDPLIVWTPDFRVADASESLLRITGRPRDGVVGYDIHDAFPGNPGDPSGNGIAQVIASLTKVRETGRRDVMPIVRHDMVRLDGSFDKRYWMVTNSAVHDEDGNVLAIVERATDARHLMRTEADTPLDQIADTLLRAHRLNAEIGDGEVKAALEEALLRIGYRIAARDRLLRQSERPR